MKRMISAVAAATMMATSGLALDTSELYGGAGLAIETASGLDAGVALVLNGGLPVVEAGEIGPGSVAVEGEFTYSMLAPSYDYGYLDHHYTHDLTVMTLAGYAAYVYEINEEYYVKPRIGLIFRSYELDSSYTYGGDGIGIALGVGGGYHLNDQMDVYVDYTRVDGGYLSHLTAGVVYRF